MYSTEEKAKKVMGMLRRVYHDAVTHDNVSAFRFPKDDEVWNASIADLSEMITKIWFTQNLMENALILRKSDIKAENTGFTQ